MSETITLRRVFQDFLQSRELRPATLKNYRQRLGVYLSDWLDLDVLTITREMCLIRHAEISKQGKSIANCTMRTLRTLFNFADYRYSVAGSQFLPNNPVKFLSQVRAWNRDKRRKTVIPVKKLPAFFRAIHQLDSVTYRDFYLLLLTTGMRSGEAVNLQWRNCDLDSGLIHLRDTKTHDDVTIPLSDYTWQLLKVRKLGVRSDYVFPGKKPNRPISGAWGKSRTQIATIADVSFCPHDLRRLYITIGDELDIKSEVVKQLVGHAPGGIHEGYTVRSPERLRRASQQITNAILAYAGVQRLTAVT